MRLENNRAGELKKMQSDYECFVPHNLKDIKLNLDSEINALINLIHKGNSFSLLNA